MFGYIRPDQKELKIKEYDLYKSAYCGLCRVMGKRYSYIYKMSLSYDFVFMVLLRLYLSPESVSFSKKRCIAHPTKKRVMMDKNTALETAADVGVIMLYHDFSDKSRDNDGAKAFLCRLLMPELKRLRKKACKNTLIKEFDSFAESKLSELSEIENNNTGSLDMPAESFGEILGCALSLGLDSKEKKIAYEIGRSLGKWIYIADAIDDVETDEKKKGYNPLLAMYKSADEAKKHGEALKFTLLNLLSDTDKALAVADETDYGIYDILTNIIRLGCVDTHEKILDKNGFQTTETRDKE